MPILVTALISLPAAASFPQWGKPFGLRRSAEQPKPSPFRGRWIAEGETDEVGMRWDLVTALMGKDMTTGLRPHPLRCAQHLPLKGEGFWLRRERKSGRRSTRFPLILCGCYHNSRIKQTRQQKAVGTADHGSYECKIILRFFGKGVWGKPLFF